MSKINKALFVLVAGSAMFLTSCIGVRTSHNTRPVSFLPNYVEMHVSLDDYTYIGTEEVTATSRRYLGVFLITDSINGQTPDLHNINVVSMGGGTGIPVNRRLKRALYSAMVKHPDAEFVVPVSVRSQVDQMFLGRASRETLKVKMYKIKEK